MAAADYFLKIEGIQGETVDDTHKNEIQLALFNVGASRARVGHQEGLR
jgi:type VI secretion system secreted protein Hcp